MDGATLIWPLGTFNKVVKHNKGREVSGFVAARGRNTRFRRVKLSAIFTSFVVTGLLGLISPACPCRAAVILDDPLAAAAPNGGMDCREGICLPSATAPNQSAATPDRFTNGPSAGEVAAIRIINGDDASPFQTGGNSALLELLNYNLGMNASEVPPEIAGASQVPNGRGLNRQTLDLPIPGRALILPRDNDEESIPTLDDTGQR